MNSFSSDKIKIAVGVSGGGRSLENLLSSQTQLPFQVAAGFSSAQNTRANAIAKMHGIPLLIEDFSNRNLSLAKDSLYNFLKSNQIDLVVLAGFLKLLPTDPAWKNKVVNIHPSLLPKYGGKGMHGTHVHDAVLAAGDKISGATVHFVNEKYDEGAIISQIQVSIDGLTTTNDVANRIFAAECKLLPWTITQFKLGKLPKASPAVLDEEGNII